MTSTDLEGSVIDIDSVFRTNCTAETLVFLSDTKDTTLSPLPEIPLINSSTLLSISEPMPEVLTLSFCVPALYEVRPSRIF